MRSHGKERLTKMQHALIALREIKAERKRYDDEVERWYASEEGKKYRFPYCRHGRSLWVDYDIACLACELADDDNPYETALGIAARRVAEYNARHKAIVSLLMWRRVFELDKKKFSEDRIFTMTASV
jgi:hypothetical protein